ncbi:MAG: MFS transporter [Actinomycetia bacterium]|nr:MFS transporter [Actinomycetes bacterium]
MAVAMVLAMTTWFSAAAVLPQLGDRWELGSTGGSMLTIAVQLGFVLGAVVSAVTNLADRIPPRRLVFLGTLLAAAANLGLLAADGLATAIPLRGLTGLALAGVYPPALKSMAGWFRAGRGTAMGVMVGALSLGSAVPHLVNGIGGLGWRSVVVATSVMTMAGGLVAELVGRDGPFRFPVAVFDPRWATQLFTQRGLRLASLGYFGHMWELYAMWAWFAAFATTRFDERSWSDPAQAAAVATFVVIGTGAVGSWLGGVVADRWGRTLSTIIAMGASGSMAAIIGFLTDAPTWLLGLLSLIWGLTVVADSAQFSAMVSELADQRYVGTAITVQLAVGFSLTVLTIFLVPVLRDGPGWGTAFAVLAAGPAIGLAAMIRLRRSPLATQLAGGRG